ncbi:hypothetical protein PVAP13_3NG158100 [Panicum virgatum]|uniref:Uncharacterized protein n=1 Tax=Panicum virgatum TaxID=38727 RepID=A0A8T0UGI7_PANVG|nr:hypothetical protein PVAP13_3NG158100 [Panicum virgatum]
MTEQPLHDSTLGGVANDSEQMGGGAGGSPRRPGKVDPVAAGARGPGWAAAGLRRRERDAASQQGARPAEARIRQRLGAQDWKGDGLLRHGGNAAARLGARRWRCGSGGGCCRRRWRRGSGATIDKVTNDDKTLPQQYSAPQDNKQAAIRSEAKAAAGSRAPWKATGLRTGW